MWRPRPAADVEHLAPYLAAQVAREFAREGAPPGICLRFGAIGDDPARGTCARDALHAVDCALALPFRPDGYRWHVFHVSAGKRFMMRDAVRQLGFRPRGGA
jgi:hypothetical protein